MGLLENFVIQITETTYQKFVNELLVLNLSLILENASTTVYPHPQDCL